MTQRSLAGVRVVDFGQYIAGPLTGLLLAQQGAEVTHIDRPGKHSIESNMCDGADLASARAIVQSADVVVENFGPGVMDRLGLAPTVCLAAKPT